jgi:hypothetical protein
MESLINGSFSRLRIAAAAVLTIMFLFSSPAAALDRYDFGDVEIGSENTVTLDIENLASPSTELTFTLSLASQGESSFAIQTPTVTIPGGQISQIELTFSPISEGACTDTLQFLLGGILPVEQMQVELIGTGIAAQASNPDDCDRMTALQKWASSIGLYEYNGKSINDHVQECLESADNHGQAVRCVAYLAATLRKEDIISPQDAWEMRMYAAKAKHQFHKKAKARFEEKQERLMKIRNKHQEKQAKHVSRLPKHLR